jgi:hypothetical protein
MSESAILHIKTRQNPAPIETLGAALTSCIDAMATQVDVENASLQPLYDLIAQIRPFSSVNTLEIEQRFAALLEVLETQPHLTPILVNYILTLLQQYSPLHFYSDTGIASNEGFFTSLTQRLVWRILPRIVSSPTIRLMGCLMPFLIINTTPIGSTRSTPRNGPGYATACPTQRLSLNFCITLSTTC